MNANFRDIQILEKMLKYCTEIEEAVNLFGDNLKAIDEISAYRNSVSMCVLQIGELSAQLSDDFKAKYDGLPWKQIKAMRNVLVHGYGSLDTEELWNTVKFDIPRLFEYCQEIRLRLL